MLQLIAPSDGLSFGRGRTERGMRCDTLPHLRGGLCQREKTKYTSPGHDGLPFRHLSISRCACVALTC